MNSVPLPIPDPARPWGSTCKGCEDKGLIACHGHFLSPADRATTSTLSPMAKPPSLIIKEAFKENEGKASPNVFNTLARNCLLPESEVKMWWEHLSTVADN